MTTYLTSHPDNLTNPLCSLPTEILEHIWCCKKLSHVDVSRLASVCSTFRTISTCNEVWKQKINQKQRWSKVVGRYGNDVKPDWKQEFRKWLSYECKVEDKISAMSAEFYLKDEVTKEAFSDFYTISQQVLNSANFMIDILLGIVNDGNQSCNLTEKYYAEKALTFMQHLSLKHEIEEFVAQPDDKQLVEDGAVYLSQWCQPCKELTLDSIHQQLDQLADDVRKQLRSVHRTHPACSHYHTTALSQNLWSSSECRTVLEAVNTVLYQQHGFKGNEDDYYIRKNSYIDEVLSSKTGIPITLSIIYMSVARRLGVNCQPVNFPFHFLLKWKEHPQLDSEVEQYTYIDAFKGGRFLTEAMCQQMGRGEVNVSEAFDAVPLVVVYERMANNLIQLGRQQAQFEYGVAFLLTVVEMSLAFNPGQLDHRIMMARLCIHLKINLNEVHDLLEPVVSSDHIGLHGVCNYLRHMARSCIEEDRDSEPPKVVQKRWSEHDEVEYMIGTVMRHKRYDYRCVIYGWDERCTATSQWIVQMGVHNLPRQHLQPFYNVLVADGSKRYAAQENLDPEPSPQLIPHPEVGKFMREFCGSHYLPNAELQQQYPEDVFRSM